MKITSLTINAHEIENLKSLISKKSLETANTTNEYELLRVKDGTISITLYKSGKLVHNGSDDSKSVINAILEKEEISNCI
jgi:ribonuclease HIII